MQAELDMTAEFQRSDALLARRQAANALKRDVRAVNEWLWALGQQYHDSVPLSSVSDALRTNGFDALEDMLLCGREGRFTQAVGRGKFLTFTWHKMEYTGHYEVVAYVN